MRRWRTILATSAIVVAIAANVMPRGPFAQTVNENYAVRYGPSAETTWGWPFPVYSRYGGSGYISALDPLAWDVAPRFTVFDPLGLTGDVVLVGVVVADALLIGRSRRNSEFAPPVSGGTPELHLAESTDA